MCVFRKANYVQTEINDLLPVSEWKFPIPKKLSKEVLIALRQWTVMEDGYLWSPTFGGRWEPGQLKLAASPGVKPSTRSGYGIYAYHDINRVGNGRGTGEVTLLGTVLQFSYNKDVVYGGERVVGYMAEAGYPHAVWIPEVTRRAKAALRYPDVEFPDENIWL